MRIVMTSHCHCWAYRFLAGNDSIHTCVHSVRASGSLPSLGPRPGLLQVTTAAMRWDHHGSKGLTRVRDLSLVYRDMPKDNFCRTIIRSQISWDLVPGSGWQHIPSYICSEPPRALHGILSHRITCVYYQPHTKSQSHILPQSVKEGGSSI
jgi:hypothetical protein